MASRTVGEMEIVLNPAGIKAMLHDPGVKAAVDRVADAIAEAGEVLAGSHTVTSTVDGHEVRTPVPVQMRRTTFDTGKPLDDEPRSGSRVRSAVLVSHPTAAGREAGMRALLAAMDAGRTAL